MFLLGEVELSYQVELKMSGKTFLVEDDETVLEAALRQALTYPMVVKMVRVAPAKANSSRERYPMGTIARAP
jgi:hypothetical protein